MKFSNWFTALAAVATVLSTGTAFAQVKTAPRETVKRDAVQRDVASTHGIVRSSQVIGMSVENTDGKELGSINDVVVDLNSGKIRYAAISFGGFLGFGEKLFAVPWDGLNIKAKRDEAGAASHVVLYNVTEKDLEKAPGFPSDNWPSFADAKFTAGIDDYYRGDKKAKNRAGESSTRAIVFRTSSVEGMSVYNRDNKELGSISELVFDLSDGKVRYAAMSYGGFLGVGDKLFAVPMSKLSVQKKNDDYRLVMNVDVEALKNAEGFDQNHWPNTADPRWSKTVDEYYGVDKKMKKTTK